MAHFPAFEASSLSHAPGAFLRGEFLKSYRVDIHGVGVTRGLGGQGILEPKAWVVSASP